MQDVWKVCAIRSNKAEVRVVVYLKSQHGINFLKLEGLQIALSFYLRCFLFSSACNFHLLQKQICGIVLNYTL